MKRYIYFHGNKAEYTGKSEILHGAKCYEAILVEGYRKGEKIWTYRAPSTGNRRFTDGF